MSKLLHAVVESFIYGIAFVLTIYTFLLMAHIAYALFKLTIQ